MLIYLNLVGKYKSNSDVIKNYQSEINANTLLTATEKERINSIIGGVFLGDLPAIVAILDELVVDNLEEGKNDLWRNFVNFLINMIKNFIGVFDKIYQSIINIGK